MVICSGELHFHNATLFGIFLLDKKGRRRRKLFSSSLLKLSYLSNSISNEQTNDSTQGRSSKMLLSSDSENVDGPAILQLQKWGPLPFDLSKVRQALISPTREILILLSYHYEALLLPLVTGEVTPEDNLEGCDSECNQGISSSARLDSSRSDSFDNIPCTSESVEVVSDKAFSLENTSSRSKHYPVVFDVKSLAWAHCGDAYNQHKDAAFREVLFMSGDHGVTVHAFRHLDRDNKNIKHSPDCMVGQGRWVEWGPSTSQYSTQENELSTLCNRDAGDLSHIKAVENSHDVNEGGNNDSSTSGFTSKKWLKTFLTEVETVKFEGKFLTRFPESSFPSSAEIISFSLLNDTKTFLDFLSQSNPVSDIKENWSGATMLLGSTNDTSVHLNSSSLNSVDSSDSISIISSSDSNNSFKCFRVFSSSSHRLIGLVLTLGDPLVNNDEEIVRSMNRIYVMVAMIHQWGIQWLSSVKLQATNVNLGQEFEWIDFQFSDNLLVCLSASGLISLYGVTTGEPIQCLDVLKICGCNPKPNLPKQEKLSIEEDLVLRQSIHDERNCNERTNNIKGALCTKGIFKRLIVASSSSFLAAVDEYGVIYLICPDDYIPELYSSINKLLPHFQHLGTGMSVGWEVGGLEIGCQKIPAGISNGDSLNVSTTENKHSLQKQEYLRGEHYAFCSQSSGFSAESPTASPSSNLSSNRVRRVILPIDGCGRDDSICFSSLGITRLVRTCNINGKKGYKIVYSKLHAVPSVNDDIGVTSQSTSLRSFGREAGLFEEAVGCAFQGCFYLVTHDGLSVVLPSVSVSSNVLSVESVGYWRPSFAACNGYQMENFLPVKRSKILYPPWKMEILDKILLYEGPEEADHMCLVNGWDLTVARLRRLQLALDYLKTDEIEESLEMLVEVNLAEEGVLRLLFTSIHRTFCKVNNDNEFALASRLLNLAASFAIKMVRKYGLLQHDKDRFLCQENSGNIITYIPPTFSNKESSEISYSRRLCEMAHFLEVIRNLQRRLNSKCKRPIQGLVDDMNALSIMDTKLVPDDSDLPSLQADVVSLSDAHYPSDLAFDGKQNLAVMPMDSFEQVGNLGPVNFEELTILSSEGSIEGRKLTSMENPKAMIARWEIDNLDLKTVVKDALHSGRLPLAVLQLHLQHLRDIVTEEEPRDIFNEVRDVGRAIAYDLFLKGETSLAVATLQRLGEDLEVNLKQLLFGTMRRSLRMQIVEEMHRYGFLTPKEWKILEQISLIERLYPSSSFWRTFNSQQEMNEVSSDSTLPEENKLQLKFSYLFNDCNIECGEVDGVVIGPWANISGNFAFPLVDEDTTHVGYWAAAAVWSDAWDQITIDRVVLDRPFLMGVHVSWEFQLEYHVCHNDWEEISKLLDIIPSSSLSEGSLLINLDGLNSSTNVGRHRVYSDYENYLWSTEDLDSVCMNIPNIKFLKSSASNMCSMWLKMRIEQTLAKKFIFLKEFWEGTAEIVGLLSRSGFIIDKSRTSVKDESLNCASDLSSSNLGEELDKDTVHAFHKLIIRHCAQYNLPNLLDLYLDHHKLVLDNDSLTSLLDAAGDCEWAKWLLLSRVKGREYDASFSNARSVILRNLVPDSNINILEIDEIVRTVDDMAEGGGEIAALATLMYASVPIQKCLCSGSVNRHISSSSQCTLENLRPALQRFPTLWRTLVAACFGQDVTGSSLGATSKNVFGNSALSNYLNWRESIFSSSGRDTSLLQMLPCWFSKAIRRLVQLFVQGPIGWQSAAMSEGESFVHRDIDFFISTHENADINAVSWEAAIQKSVEEELHASSIKESGFGIEHHLHRGRALAAFNHLLSARVEKLKSGQSGGSAHGQTNVQADVQMLLAPVTQSEQSLLSSVTPLAIMHFEDSILVAACAFLLELCGLSASMLRVDIAALRRIASFYGSSEHDDHMKHLSPKTSAMHAVSHEGDIPVSLARALADDYLHRGSTTCSKEKENSNDVPTSNQASRALVAVLRQLEKVSLPSMLDGKTCGAWLFDGSGDGTEIRSQQKAASQYWSLVTSFCQMHQLPVSTKYLAVLARDNDWIGFLTEAQVGEYPFDLIIQVASKEFSDPRLKIHITTVLRSMYLTRKKASSPSNSTSWGRSNVIDFSTQANVMFPVELFELLAKCEKQKNPGEALLLKAKDLRWSLLAMIASCFPDVTSLSCLTVWLEITAARETSSIKVNDIASQIANSVGAAVEATNSLTAPSRIFSFRYNRKNAKRRRLIESTTGKQLTSTPSNVSTSGLVGIPVAQDFIVKEETINYLEEVKVFSDPDEALVSLSKMVGVLCEQRLFLPLLRAFEMFLPSCSLLPFIRALQAFSQMRLSEASAHLASFSARIKEEPLLVKTNIGRDGQIGSSWISSTAVGAADALLSTCPSAYEKRCLLQLLAATDFCDGGSAATCFRRLYWKINLAEPSLRKDDELYLGDETLDDASLLMALEKNGHWEQARNWARQLEASGGPWKFAVNRVTEKQAEAMVAEWKEYLWDVPEERAALWSHCQTLFLRYSFPALQAGSFFLNHAEAVEGDVPARELHEMLLLALQWLSGTMTQSNPVYPLHLLREIETRVWLLAVESEAQFKNEGEFTLSTLGHNLVSGNNSSIIDRTASIVTKMDNHLNVTRNRVLEKNDTRESSLMQPRSIQALDATAMTGGSTKTKRRAKSYLTSRRPLPDAIEKNIDSDDGSASPMDIKNSLDLFKSLPQQEESVKLDVSLSRWEERVGPEELERAVLSLLEFGQVTAAQQLQQKLSPAHVPSEFLLIDAALKLAAISTPSSSEVSVYSPDEEVLSVIKSYSIIIDNHPLQVLEDLATKCTKDGGLGLCKRIIAVVKAANVLGLQFSEAFAKRPLDLLQLLSLKAQDSLEEAKLLVRTHSMPPASIAQILAESFLKGLLAAHRGGYMDSQKEEGPAPLLWRISDFLKWAELCPSEPEIGHALMRLVITGQEIPRACEVELLILSHHFYKSSACLDGVDVLVALAATRVESYVSEGDFSCLARLVIGVSNFHALNFILGILIENGQLELLLQKYSAADTTTGTAETVRGFRMAVLTSLKHFNPYDLDAFAMVYNHFDMKHETAALLESRAMQSIQQWFLRYDRDQSEDLLESMCYFIKAAEVHSTIDAGNKTRYACAQASLLSLQIRMPDFDWLNLSMTNARRALVEQSRFLEALIVAEAYNLNQPSEWALVLWNQMFKPELTEEFVAEFVSVLPLQPSMLADIAKFYRAEVAARVDHSNFSMWLSPAEWLKHLARSFRCLLKRTRDLRLRLQLANVATGFGDMVEACMKELDRVPDTAGPLVLRKGHGGAYLPLM